jgi:hypothetical protein
MIFSLNTSHKKFKFKYRIAKMSPPYHPFFNIATSRWRPYRRKITEEILALGGTIFEVWISPHKALYLDRIPLLHVGDFAGMKGGKWKRPHVK